MPETSEIRCPQCATLYAADSAQCPHCGLPNAPEQRIRQIERLLGGEQPTPPVQPVPAAASPIRQEPASAAFAQNWAPSPAPPAGASLQWETEDGKPVGNGKTHSRGWFRRHLLAVSIGGAVLVIAAIVAVVSVVMQSTTGYRSSPENLVRGLQKAVETQDVRLFIELSSPPETDIDTAVSQNANMFIGNEGTRVEIEDVIMGKNGQVGIVAIKVTDVFSDQMNGTSRQSLYCYQQSGQWYMDGGGYLGYHRIAPGY